MAKLLYGMISSLDGYIADRAGSFAWAEPDEATHALVNDVMRSVGTVLCGRRMYEVLRAWDDPAMRADDHAVVREFADIWAHADKIVYSRALAEVGPRARVERAFDAEEVRVLKASSSRDLSIGGPEVAALAMRAGLVDELHLFVAPIVVGGGTRALPNDLRMPLVLREARRVGERAAYLHYEVMASASASTPEEA